MEFNYTRAIITFFIGFIISFIVGSFFEDIGLSIMTAICYLGAIISGSESKKA